MNGSGDSLLRNVRFLRLWVGQGISFVGDAVSMVALVVLIAQITGSAEDSYRLLMRCYAWLGMRGRALRQYRLCEKILLQEYGTAPSMETRSLYRSLMGDESA